MSANEPKMFDGKMILAIGLTMVFWVGYQSHLEKKYPEAYKKPKAEKTVDKAAGGAGKVATESAAPEMNSPESKAETKKISTEVSTPKSESLLYKSQKFDLLFSSQGFAVEKVTLNNLTDREDEAIQFLSTQSALNFETNVVGRREPLYFKLKRTEDHQIYGEAQIGNMLIKKIVNIDPNSYLLNITVSVENANENFSGLVTRMTSPVEETDGGSFIGPGLNYQEYYVNYDEGEEDRLVLQPGTEEKESFSKVSIASLASQYFALALINKSDVMPDFQGAARVTSVGESESTEALGVMTHMMLSRGKSFDISYQAYAGPKSWDILEGINAELTSLINFGFFKTIAHWIFQLLRSIHAAVGNWGIAIILLTVLVRIVVLPFNIMSYKSMKAMAKIQPQMKAIKEKYKGEPQKANQEIMVLMKEAKANPLGGCLPMFLQIPVFFALYQVLGQSIELYKAPFGLWINDLSQHDPFFIFPVAMGITMFFQQKITPSTLEPAQQKMLMFMPLFLIVVMATLPSGLTLYMFVSTLFGVLQQLYFMKGDRKREELATA